jgi:hypothetical protein
VGLGAAGALVLAALAIALFSFQTGRVLLPVTAPMIAFAAGSLAAVIVRGRLPAYPADVGPARPSIVALLVLMLAVGSAPAAGAADAVAIVTEVTGHCTQRARGELRPIVAYDRLSAGVSVEVSPGAGLVLVYADGKRWKLGAGAVVRLDATGVSTTRGPVESLPAYPPLPRLEEPAAHARVGERVAAVRVRGGRVRGLYPRSPGTVLPEHAVLRSEPASKADAYRVEVEEESGRVVFQAESSAPAVTVSPGILKPGGRYFWRVRSLGPVAPPARGEADFVVLPADVLEARRGLQGLLPAGAGPQVGLLAEIDRGLGLWQEARDRLQSALKGTPDDSTLQELLARVEAGLVALDKDN